MRRHTSCVVVRESERENGRRYIWCEWAHRSPNHPEHSSSMLFLRFLKGYCFRYDSGTAEYLINNEEFHTYRTY